MLKNYLSVFFTFMIVVSVCGQDKHDPALIERNKVKEIVGYIFEGENTMDSFLITREYFNTKGKRTKIMIFDSSGVKNEYHYHYKYDTLRTERITKFRGKFHSITKILYDDKNREVNATDYDENGNKTGTYSKTKYHDRIGIKETKSYISGKLAIHTKAQYDKNNQLIRNSVKEKGKWIQEEIKVIIQDTSLEKNRDFESSGVTVLKTTRLINKKTKILGHKSALTLFPEDVLTTEIYKYSNGLTKLEKLYINEKLVSVLKYYYVADKT
jgi:hypothetical protein